MCNFSGKLIAWLDHELTEAEAINVAWHVRQCAECRHAVGSYQEISGAFLDCCAGALPAQRARSPWIWTGIAGATAAAILLAAVLTRSRPEQLPTLPPAMPAPAIAFEKTPARMLVARVRHKPRPRPIRTQWIAEEPTVEIALPADALFPPGAVPAGFSFIADIRPQP
jgi:Putative zinc-finger